MAKFFQSSFLTNRIAQLSDLLPRRLTFSCDLEASFEARTGRARAARLQLEGIIAIVMFDLFLFVDYSGPPHLFFRALVVRLGIITPLALTVNILMLQNPVKFLRESSISFVCCLVGLTHLSLESHSTPVSSAYAQTGLLTVLVFANTVMRLRFPYALGVSAVLFAGDLIFLINDQLLSAAEKMLGLGLTLITLATTLIANYSSNREERVQYLMRRESESLVKELNDSNARLAEIADQDSLTGLANRHAFDLKFEELYNASLADRTVLSIVMVDVDHFKVMNDTYGHLYGDKVLKRIANLVAEALRCEGDFAARFGGEEFVILLPTTASKAAILVAERLRNLVEVAGFPPIRAEHNLFHRITATVSCGVASSSPRLPLRRHEILEAADKALYQAKNDGRNQVRSAPGFEWPEADIAQPTLFPGSRNLPLKS
ncbi:hypothetical protein BH10ACI4_BH10ACI4_05560 [soil metagenome]